MNNLANTPTERFGLIDIDGTLVDGDYQVTSDSIYGSIQDIQDQGWTLGLSSDTPLEAMKLWRKSFGLNGPIVAERGAVLELPGRLLQDRTYQKIFRTLYHNLRDEAGDTGARIFEGNPVQLFLNQAVRGEPGDEVLLLNSLRTQSFGLFVRRIDEKGCAQIDNALTTSWADRVRLHYTETFEEDLNHNHGLLIVSREGINKRIGTQKLVQELAIGKIVMIGNSIADHIGDDLAVHYAVGNADNDYKESAEFVAQSTYSAGVSEILDLLSAI